MTDLLGDVLAVSSVAVARPALLLMHSVANFLVNSFTVVLCDSVANLLRDIQTLLLCFDLNCGLTNLIFIIFTSNHCDHNTDLHWFILALHLLDRSAELLGHRLA